MMQMEDRSITVTLMLPTPLHAKWLINIVKFPIRNSSHSNFILTRRFKRRSQKIINLYKDI